MTYTILKNKYSAYFVFFIFLFFYYYQLILQNPILNYDDFSLVGPIHLIKSIDHYFKLKNTGVILDVQPVRDFIYFITFKLNQFIPFLNFHLVNTLIWFFTIVALFNIFLVISNNFFISFLISTIVCIAPISTSSVAWISAQKHLLTTFFIVFLTYKSFQLKIEKITFLDSLLFFALFNLAIYSHPINILWPLWFFSFLILKKVHVEKIFLMVFPLVISALVCLYLNMNYYDTTFVQANAGITKFDPNFSFDISSSFLAFGRYVYISIFPFNALPSPHYIGSIENIIGLFISIPIIYSCYYHIKKQRDFYPLLFLLYFIIPLLPVTLKVTRIFCSDTYVLNASLGFYFLLIYFGKEFSTRILKLLLILYLGLCLIFNYSYVKIFMNSHELWNYSYNKEATPDSSIALAKTLLSLKQFDRAEVLIRRVHDWQPENIELYSLAANNIFLNPALSLDYKIKRLEKFQPKRPIVHFYLAILYANSGNADQVSIEAQQVLGDVGLFLVDFPEHKERVLGTYLAICEHFKIPSGIASFNNFKSYFKSDDWNYSLINKYKIESYVNNKFNFDL